MAPLDLTRGTVRDIGGAEDSFRLRIGGADFLLVESYEITSSFFKQPAAFTIRLGPKLVEGDDFRERLLTQIFDAVRPGMKFEILAPASGGWIRIQSGLIDSIGSPSAETTMVEIHGRDFLAPVFDSFFLAERAYTEATYYDLTRKMLDEIGLTEEKGHVLYADEQNQQAINRSRRAVAGDNKTNEETVRAVETNATSGTGKTLYLAPKAKLGMRRYDFLQQQYKLGGLFLMATGEGNFMLTRPHRYILPEVRLNRKSMHGANGQRIERGNILAHEFRNDTTLRHSKATIFGRSGGGKAGRQKIRGECIDEEMVKFGLDKPIVLYDEDVKNNAEADFVARRVIADERRESWKLVYIVAGHSTKNTASLDEKARGFWLPDTTVIVNDDQLGIQETTFWIETVTFRRGAEGTTTKLELCHPADLDFVPPPQAVEKNVIPPKPVKLPPLPPSLQEIVQHQDLQRRTEDLLTGSKFDVPFKSGGF